MRRTYLFGLGLALALVAALALVPSLQAGVARYLALASLPSPAPAATSNPAATAAPAPTATSQPAPTATPRPEPTATPTTAPSPTPAFTPTPAPTATPKATASYLANSTLLTIYGRAFGVAPILGRLGSYNNFQDMAADIQPFDEAVRGLNGGKSVIPTVHLIYGLAMPCVPNDDCLLYLEGTDPEVVKHYIEPAASRGWQVILDTQLGRSDPVTQVKRMIDKGYLNYDNVHVALDPEFSSVPGHDTPGIPIGSVDASQINEVQRILDEHVRKMRLPHKKMLIVHQFGDPNVNDGVPFMIRNKPTLRTDFENVDLVIDADGFGHPDSKTTKFNRMTDPEVYPFVRYRGIKLFLPNPHEKAGHYDQPQMNFREVFGAEDTPGGYRMKYKPDVVVIA